MQKNRLLDSYDSIGTEILLFALKNGMKVLEHDIKIKKKWKISIWLFFKS